MPQYVSAGDTATPPTAPSRMGYTFYRWTTDEAGTNPYDFSTPVTADLTLYAQWTPANASYVVVYWQETRKMMAILSLRLKKRLVHLAALPATRQSLTQASTLIIAMKKNHRR